MARILAYLQCTLQNFFQTERFPKCQPSTETEMTYFGRITCIWILNLCLFFNWEQEKVGPNQVWSLGMRTRNRGQRTYTQLSPSTPGSVCFTGINSFTFLQSLRRNKLLLQFRKHEQRGYKSYPKSPSQYNPECGFDLLFWLKNLFFQPLSVYLLLWLGWLPTSFKIKPGRPGEMT